MVYNTGSRDDWDHVSRITGDPAWAWDAMAHYRDLNQKYVPPNDGHDDVSQKQLSCPLPRSYHPSQTNQYIPSAHSRNGMVPISLPGFPEDIDSRVIATTAEPDFASEFPFQRDMNTGNTVRFLAVVYCPDFFLSSSVSGDRSALVGYRVPSATVSVAAPPPPTSDRIILIARTYTSYFTLKLQNFLRQPITVPQPLASTELSLDSQPDPPVS